MSQADAQYYPALFSRPEVEHADQEGGQAVPQNTLYDMPLQSQHMPCQRHATVFGFSHDNRANVLSRVRKMVAVRKKEEGKNYVNIWTEDPAELERLFALNHEVVGGEIIGVFRRNFGVARAGDIYPRKKGVFRLIREYFFGED